MIEQLQMAHTTVCHSVKVSQQLQEVRWSLCVHFVCVVSDAENLMLVVVRDEGTYEPGTEILSRWSRINPLTREVMWVYTTRQCFLSLCCRTHKYRQFGILLVERHIEIEHVLRPAPFWNCTQHKVVIPFQLFGITNRSHLRGSRCPRRTCLDSREPAHPGCLLE
jgi:hypothetical protein